MRVMIIDDDCEVGQALVSLFRHAGHEARWVADGQSALPIARREPPDVVLLDLDLADGPSLHLLPHLAGARIYIITAARLSRDVRDAASRGGAAGLLEKSMAAGDLLARVERG